MELRFGILSIFVLISTSYLLTTAEIQRIRQITLPKDMIELWSKKFSEKIVTLTKNFTAFDYLFDKFSKNGARVPQKGDLLVNNIADNIQEMLTDKIDAVKKLVFEAERLYENYSFDENLEYDYPNNKKLLSDEDMYSIRNSDTNNIVNMEMDFHSIRLQPNTKFYNMSVNSDISTVQVATNVFDGSATIMNGAYWSSKLDETFKSNNLMDRSIRWQYFCSSDGFFRIFPGTKWPRDNEDTGPDMFDCRMRSWYLQAATCPKNIVILIDTSGSMKGLRMQIARSTVHQILDTLTDDDSFNIIRFSDEINYVDSCFNFTMVPASAQNKARLREKIDLDIVAKKKANFEKALIEAFNLLNYSDHLKEKSSGEGKFLCNKAILLVTDGVPENYKSIFVKYNWPDKRIRVFTYLIGREVSDEREVKWLACANKGYYSHISTLSDVRENVQNYVKVLSRPLVINRDHLSTWTSVYLDHFSTLNMSEGLKFMTTVSMPVFDTRNETYRNGHLLGVVGTDVPIKAMVDYAPTYLLGPNAFVFLINRDGYILHHPDFRPQEKGNEPGEVKMNPNYSNMDMLDVMLATNKKELEWLKESMLQENNYKDDIDIELLVHYDKMRRVARRNYSVFYRKILDTAFSIAIALPSTSLVKNDVGKHVEYDLKNCLNSSGFELAPWRYCTDMDDKMTSRDKIYLILEHSKKPRESLSKICDTDLLDLLRHDNQMTLDIERKWMDMATQFPTRKRQFSGYNGLSHKYKRAGLLNVDLDEEPWTSYGVELVFVGTKGGLTKYLKVQNLTNENYIKRRRNTIEADYYRRAVEGVERIDNEPEYNVTFSIPLKKEPDINKTMVTGSIPIVIRDGPTKKGIRAVAGLQMKYDKFAEMFFESFSTCERYPCPSAITCYNDSVKCFLLDTHGYVMASKTPEKDLGKFFGDVDGQVMTYLVYSHRIFVGYNFTDHQAICDIKASDREQSSASFIFNPFKGLLESAFWTITEIALFFTELSWKSLWSGLFYRVDAQIDDQLDIDCELAKLLDYEDDDMESLERFALTQLKSYCNMRQHRDEVIGHRSCDKTFTLYRSNLNALYKPIQDVIKNCESCVRWSVCDRRCNDTTFQCDLVDPDCEVECVEYARPCQKSYIAKWIEDTNLIFVMAADNCECFDEMPFNIKPKEDNITKEEACSKSTTFKDVPAHCHDYSKIEDDKRCGVAGVSVSWLLLLFSLLASRDFVFTKRFSTVL